MFTGIIECVGTIVDARRTPGGRYLRIKVGPMAGECALGASVCVSGVCLSVIDVAGTGKPACGSLAFDVITETLRRSTLGSKRVGDRVNLERSLRVGDRLEGHFVQGHVDGTGLVDRVRPTSSEHVLWLSPQEHLTPYVIPKGSVAVDGVSLAVAAVEAGRFSVALIPTTLERTTLSSLLNGDPVNIETDIIARTIVHRLGEVSTHGGLRLDALKEAGFV